MKKNIRVLIADDHMIVRMGLATLIGLEPDLSVVGEAENGESAIALAKELRPDVIIMDLMMPGLNGADATDAILKSMPQAKILLLTTFGAAEGVRRALTAGAAGALVKDSSNDQLLDAIRAVAAGRRVLSPEIAKNVESAPSVDLTDRQREIVRLLVKGLTNQDIARISGISLEGVKSHLKSIYQKLDVSSRTEAASRALVEGLVSP